MMEKKFDYKNLGFKAGLEIHQELELSTKLFCHCPPLLQKGAPDFLIKRFFRPVMGELGEFDKAMLIEYQKNKTIVYEGFYPSTCTYDIDETPPFKMNQEAIDLGLMITLMLNGSVIDELHVCRKNYLDGSVPCGFQRTLIIGVNGILPLEKKNVGINTISIEEDAARKVKTEGNIVFYRLDRLGIPLIELVTDPVLDNPDEIFEAAYRLGLLLRSTGKAKRGIGTVRQDINLSIRGGSRVELKGVQKLDWIERLVYHEIERQLNLLDIKNELLKRKSSADKILNNPIDLSEIFSNTDCKIIQSNLKKHNVVMGIRLEKFSKLLGKKIQLDKSFGYEIVERIITLTGLKGIIHSDEDLLKYQINQKEVSKIIEKLKCANEDAFAMVIGDKNRAIKAIEILVDRCKMAYKGVPLETRRVSEDGKSKFERELHGGARLYPDTDSTPFEITKKRFDIVKQKLPYLPWEIEKEYSLKYKLPEKTIRNLILDDKINLFIKIVDDLKIESILVSTTLIETLKALQREKLAVEEIPDEKIYEVFSAVQNKKVAKEAIEEIIRLYAKQPELNLDEIIVKLGLESISKDKLSLMIDEVVNKNLDIIKEKKERAFAPLMGEVMKKVRGKIDGKIVSELLKEKLKKLDAN